MRSQRDSRVAASVPSRIASAIAKGRFGVLFWLLVATIATPVVAPDGPIIRRVMSGLLFVVMLSGLNAISNNRREFLVGILMAVPAVVLNVVGLSRSLYLMYVVSEFAYLAFFVYLAILILRWTLRQREVDPETIYGAVSVYLLMALAWGLAYYAIALTHPGSFNWPEQEELGVVQANRAAALESGSRVFQRPGWEEISESAQGTLMYYSFVTLTTLGYGDIYPTSDAARILAMLEATLGQLYLVILVARLVGLYTAQQMEERKRAPPP